MISRKQIMKNKQTQILWIGPLEPGFCGLFRNEHTQRTKKKINQNGKNKR